MGTVPCTVRFNCCVAVVVALAAVSERPTASHRRVAEVTRLAFLYVPDASESLSTTLASTHLLAHLVMSKIEDYLTKQIYVEKNVVCASPSPLEW